MRATVYYVNSQRAKFAESPSLYIRYVKISERSLLHLERDAASK